MTQELGKLKGGVEERQKRDSLHLLIPQLDAWSCLSLYTLKLITCHMLSAAVSRLIACIEYMNYALPYPS